ncbi:hypothetical protein LJR084_001950 [Variovorax sp. LjRoot84]|uniref:hypothetical protein n=1 Tax=Variovorax sp. LjRoot84 TaxID=3342340 RepID=UPI003ECD453F
MENEDADPVGKDPVAIAAAHAARLGLIKEGDKLDQMLVDFWMAGVDESAAVADRFVDPQCTEHTVGDVIRAELHE